MGRIYGTAICLLFKVQRGTVNLPGNDERMYARSSTVIGASSR